MQDWLDAGSRAIVTAVLLLDEEQRKADTVEDADGRQMSG